jgi:hypothetical protein
MCIDLRIFFWSSNYYIVPSSLSRFKYWFKLNAVETVLIIMSKYPSSFSKVLGSDVE